MGESLEHIGNLDELNKLSEITLNKLNENTKKKQPKLMRVNNQAKTKRVNQQHKLTKQCALIHFKVDMKQKLCIRYGNFSLTANLVLRQLTLY